MPWMAWLLGVVVLICAVALTWRVAVHRTTRGRRRALGAAAHGRSMEALAPRLLERRGYTIVEVHPQHTYVFTVDDAPQVVHLRADLLVERDARRYAVEIKTGRAAKPTLRGTRRQLLEYALHYDVDGVLLLDADNDVLSRVDFDLVPFEDDAQPPHASLEAAPSSRSRFGLGVGVGLGIAAGIWLILR